MITFWSFAWNQSIIEFFWIFHQFYYRVFLTAPERLHGLNLTRIEQY
jgi:hypothetical protein